MNAPSRHFFPSPEDAEAAFYEAIARNDLNALMAVWAEDEEVICIHPTGQRLVGLAVIREGWRHVLGGAPLRIEPQRVMQWQSMPVSVHQIVETLHVENQNLREDMTKEKLPSAGPGPGPLLVTHVYFCGPHGWRLVCRHASIGAWRTARATSNPDRRILH
jgi:hypothetical protein